jgi:hypothetical protein
MKIAIFVEGYSEAIFIKEYLLKKYDCYINIDCFTLLNDNELKQAPFNHTCEDCDLSISIINIGNDKAVLYRIKQRERHMFELGYDKIIGLRDMYSEAYCRDKKIIDGETNKKFIDSHNNEISKMSDPTKIHFCFAIMELEAWFLGMPRLLLNIHNDLTIENIEIGLGYNLETLDPESTFFHPAKDLNKIYNLVGLKYTKSKNEINSLISRSKKEDFEQLNSSVKCNSFSNLFSKL